MCFKERVSFEKLSCSKTTLHPTDIHFMDIWVNFFVSFLCFAASRWKNVYSSPSQTAEAGVSASSSAGYLKSTNKTLLTSGSSGMALTHALQPHHKTHTRTHASFQWCGQSCFYFVCVQHTLSI